MATGIPGPAPDFDPTATLDTDARAEGEPGTPAHDGLTGFQLEVAKLFFTLPSSRSFLLAAARRCLLSS